MSQVSFMGGTAMLSAAAGAASGRVLGPAHGLRVLAAAVPPSGGRRRGDGGRSRQSDPNNSNHSKRGRNFEKKQRRKGRPEWKRSPDDSPLRDGNRDRLVGLVTLRAARTLAYYLSETSPVVYNWLNVYIAQNPIPRDGAWDDVSGDTFLRNLLKMPTELATGNWGRNSMFSSGRGMQVDPRQIAMRIMEIRLQISKEMMQDLETMTDENNHLMAETLMNSLSLSFDNVVEHPVDKAVTDSSPATIAVVETPTAIAENPASSLVDLSKEEPASPIAESPTQDLIIPIANLSAEASIKPPIDEKIEKDVEEVQPEAKSESPEKKPEKKSESPEKE